MAQRNHHRYKKIPSKQLDIEQLCKILSFCVCPLEIYRARHCCWQLCDVQT